ncbi:MAG: MFS transporter [Actinomycetaceae bacterium]|nr:MFS transporter [Actinomycetaceae bacterium]
MATPQSAPSAENSSLNNSEPTPSQESTTSSRNALIVGSIALFTDMLIHGLAVPVLPLLPSVVEQGPAATGLLFSSYAIAMIISTFFAGRMVDKCGPKTPLMIGLITLAVATLIFSTGGPYPLLFLARFAQGIAGGMSWVAALSLIAATTSFEQRGQSMGIAMSTITLGVLIGPPLSGFLVEHFDTAIPFIVGAAVALFDGLLRIFLIKGSPRVSDDAGGPLSVFQVNGSPAIVAAIIIGAGVLSGIEPVLPLHLEANALTIGLLFGLASLAAIIANPIVGSLMTTYSSKLLIGSGVLITGGSLLIIGCSTHLWHTCVGMVLLGVSSALILAPTTTLIGEQGFRSTPPTLGGSFALYNFAYAAGLAFGPVVTGLGVQHYGFAPAMAATCGVFLLLGGLSVPYLPSRAVGADT